MGRFVGATIVIVGAAPSASMQNLVGAGSSWIRLRRSTNSNVKFVILGIMHIAASLGNRTF